MEKKCRCCLCTQGDAILLKRYWITDDLCSHCIDHEKIFLQSLEHTFKTVRLRTTGAVQKVIEDAIMIMEGKHGCSVRGMRLNTIHLVEKHFPNLHRAHSIGLTNRAFKL